MRYAAINDMYTGKRRPSLNTLEAVIAGLKKITEQRVELNDLLEVRHEPAPLHSDPERPALDAAHLKTFRLRPRGTPPAVKVPSEVLVAALRRRDPT